MVEERVVEERMDWDKQRRVKQMEPDANLVSVGRAARGWSLNNNGLARRGMQVPAVSDVATEVIGWKERELRMRSLNTPDEQLRRGIAGKEDARTSRSPRQPPHRSDLGRAEPLQQRGLWR